MSETHFWTVVVGNPERSAKLTHYGPFDSLADAKRWAMPYLPDVYLTEHVITEVIGEREIGGKELEEWDRANPPGSVDNPIPVTANSITTPTRR
jgi:hypothetical protein